MKITNKLSIATLVMAGVFATGCSQQSAGGSQVSGGSQSQIEGGSQVGGSQQQVETAVPVVIAPTQKAVVVPRKAPPRMVKKRVYRKPPAKRYNRWTHTHPAVPRCTKSIRHTHKYNRGNHRHAYGCRKAAPRRAMVKRAAVRTQKTENVDVFALQRKLKAKGYYKGSIDGVVGPQTRSALQRFMQR